MADRVLFIGWGRVVAGREERALEVFNESMGFYGRLQQQGKIEGFNTVLLDPNARLAGYTRKGFSARYQACRPKPPGALVELLLRLAGTRRPHVVVDLGSGTGISTRIWAPDSARSALICCCWPC